MIKVFIFPFVFIAMLFALTGHAQSDPSDMVSKVQGEWFTPKWSYGFRVEGKVGYVTKWNYKYNPNDKTTVGDKVFTIDEITETGFKGKQKFFNGKWVPIVVTLLDRNTLKLEAGPEVWNMVRK